ncbi:PREDICTED: C-type lectin domain family 2 member E-like isoform X5 [Calidris pugnax]|uniref:C-type lectin domain family 2 member E-like isoform X5 n=1 Tax=Calidris pugnax TaxID=198806 RepID=UPI00071E2780|nr:PREDICTED: C-type lectin domain family 2 member E-like isoform X5 [Calidris pugnax]
MAEALGDAGEGSPVMMPSQQRAVDEGTSEDSPVMLPSQQRVVDEGTIKKCPSCPSCPSPVLPSCREKGIGFGEKCFYFVEEEADWNGSESSCLALGAHLATIDTREELRFLLRYRSFWHYWVGLWRESSGPWKWFNGSLYNNMFDVQGTGQCAYVNTDGISSDWCSQMKYSVCSQLQRHPIRIQNFT